jgi:hypothetical protein
MNSGVAVVGPWERAGTVAGYGAALALTPYLLIKVSSGAAAGALLLRVLLGREAAR